MLRDTLQNDQIAALKGGQKDRLEVLRFILAQIKNKEIEKKDKLSDEETIIVLQKFAKELREAMEAFEKGNRTDLVAHNKKQLEIVAVYLPTELGQAELEAKVEDLFAQNAAAVASNPNAIIGICMKALRAEADSARIMAAIKKIQAAQ